MDDRFEGVRRKLRRAQQLRDQINNILRTMTDSWTTETRVEGGYRSVYVASIDAGLSNRLAEISLLYGDSIHNLRVACDHFAFAVVPSPSSDTTFPIWRPKRNPFDVPTERQMHDCIRNRMPAISTALHDAIFNIQPYHTGRGGSLWIVHSLDVVDKHHLIIPTALVCSGLIMDSIQTLQSMLPDAQFTDKDREQFRLHILAAEPEPLEVGAKLYSEVADTRHMLEAGALTHVFRIQLQHENLGSVPRYGDELLEMVGTDTVKLLEELMAVA